MRYLVIFFLLFLSSCHSKREIKDEILRIDLNEAVNRSQLNASDFISSIEYVALETSSQCLLGEAVFASVSENFILTFSYNGSCLLFSRKGQFIRSIGQRGNGPQDYLNNSYYVKIDEKSDRIYLMGMDEIVAYTIAGKFVKKLNLIDFYKKGVLSDRPMHVTHWKENLFCANMNLNSGKEPLRCVIFTLEGEVVKTFPNHVFFETEKGRMVRSTLNSDVDIYLYNEQLYFKEILCDTLFRITDQLDFVPEIIFDLPGKKMPTNMRGYFKTSPPEYMIRGIHEVDNYLFWFGTLQYLYDKKKNQLISFEGDPLLNREITAPLPGGATNTRTTSLRGLSNDIDGGLPFAPHHLSHIQNDQQMICIYQSYLLKEKLTDEHFARYKIKDPEAHKRLRNLLENLDWEDNPVLMIATFK